MEDIDECKRTFKAALWCLKYRMTTPQLFIHEIMLTSKCDHVYNLSKVRSKIEKNLGEKTMQNILNYNESITDYRKAIQTVFHYKDWASNELSKAIV